MDNRSTSLPLRASRIGASCRHHGRWQSSSSSSRLGKKPSPALAPGEDESRTLQSLLPLLNSGVQSWSLTGDGTGLEKTFRFKSFKATWDFMNAVAQECKKQRHHPEWSNVYNMTFIRWTTHHPQGLSAKDILMARFCDGQAAIHKEIREEGGPSEDESRTMQNLARAVTDQNKNCCDPKDPQK